MSGVIFLELPSTSYVGGTILGKFFRPNAVNCDCPSCGRAANFSFADCKVDTGFCFLTHQKLCAACGATVKFFGNYFDFDDLDFEGRLKLCLFVLSTESNLIQSPDFSANISEPLNRAFVSAVASYDSGNYAAATVLGRRTLEGIFKSLVTEKDRRKKLNDLIDIVAKENDLSAPLHKLSHAVREGGNLGAHFDLDKEPTEELARMLVSLVQYLIEFLYVLPSNIEKLEKALE